MSCDTPDVSIKTMGSFQPNTTDMCLWYICYYTAIHRALHTQFHAMKRMRERGTLSWAIEQRWADGCSFTRSIRIFTLNSVRFDVCSHREKNECRTTKPNKIPMKMNLKWKRLCFDDDIPKSKEQNSSLHIYIYTHKTFTRNKSLLTTRMDAFFYKCTGNDELANS